MQSRKEHKTNIDMDVQNGFGMKDEANANRSAQGMIWLMRTAQEHMLNEHGLTFTTSRPFALTRPTTPAEPLTVLSGHVQAERRAVLAAVYGKLNHWTVVTRVSSDYCTCLTVAGHGDCHSQRFIQQTLSPKPTAKPTFSRAA